MNTGSNEKVTNNDLGALIKSANQALKTGDWEQAKNQYIAVLQFQPDDPVLYNNLGIVFYKMGNLAKACEIFEYAVYLDPVYFDAIYNLSNIYHHMSKREKAIQYAEMCINLNPAKTKGHTLLEKVTKGFSYPHLGALKEKPEKKLNILFVQESPCIRNYKTATALVQRGHSVSLAYTRHTLSQMYPGLSDDIYANLYLIKSYKQLWELSKQFDIVHCHNEPDILTVAALAGDVPVIHDTHDLISLRSPDNENLKYFEGIANKGAHGRVYTTPFQLIEAQKRYGVDGPSIVMYNYTSQQDLVKEKLPRLSNKDGHFHLVYEGGIGGNAHRNFVELFHQIAGIKGVHIHIYPTQLNDALRAQFSGHANIHLNGPVSPKKIIREMSQYDAGIIPFNLQLGNKAFLNTTIANKLFEYLAAGLPVITSNLNSYQQFFKQVPVGYTFNTAADVHGLLARLREMVLTIDFDQFIYTYENEIYRLEWLYANVIKEYVQQNSPVIQKPEFSPEPVPDVVAKTVTETESSPESDDMNSPILSDKDVNYELDVPLDALGTLQMNEMNLNIYLSKIIINHYKWLRLNGFSGYDSKDIDSIQKTSGGDNESVPQDALHLHELPVTRLSTRMESGISKVIYPDAFGMFLNALCLLPKDIKNLNLDTSIDYLVHSIEQKQATHVFDTGWGYPYKREMDIEIDAGYPDAINTYFVGTGYLNLFLNYQQPEYLDKAIKIAEFFENNLYFAKQHLPACFALTPHHNHKTNAANLLVVDFMLSLGEIAINDKWVDLARTALSTSLSQINSEGMLDALIHTDGSSNIHTKMLDHVYHLLALNRIQDILNDSEITAITEYYLQAFNNTYINKYGFPVESRLDHGYVDSYTVGLLLQLYTSLVRNNPDYMEQINKLLSIIFSQFVNESGSFISHLLFKNDFLCVNTFPHFIRNQASMLNGIVSLFDYLLQKADENPQLEKINMQLAT